MDTKLHPILIRQVAQALHQVFRENQYADKVIESALRQNPKAGSRDRAFIAETTYEIVRFFRLYETAFGRQPQWEPDFWQIIGIHFLEKGWKNLPDLVEFKGLRQPEILESLAKAKASRALRESVPDWLDALGAAEISEKWDETLQWLNRPAEVVLRANRLKINRLDLQKKLAAEGVETRTIGEADALVLGKRANVFRTESFKNGFFEVQDFSSQQVAPMLDVQPGQRVVDACAGAGGKTLHLAALLGGKGSIIALDTLAWKLDELRTRASRAGASNIQTRPIENSKTIKRLHGSADRLLLDVPCSGLGVLRRNPDSKWKLQPDFVENIRRTQQQILQSYSPILRPGGKMVYATCSILPSENLRQVEEFLASEAGKSFKLESERSILPQDEGFDGFFMALLVKK